MHVLIIKCIALLGIGGVTFGGAYFPYWLKKQAFSENSTNSVLTISNNLAGGVFVSAALMHLIPDAVENASLSMVLLLVTFGILFADLMESITVSKAAFYKDPQNLVYVPQQSYFEGSGSVYRLSEALLADSHAAHHFAEPQPTAARVSSIYSMEGSHCPSDFTGTLPVLQDSESLHGHTVHHHHITVGGSGALSWLIFAMLGLHALITGAALGITSHSRDSIILGIVIFAHKGVESFAVAFNFAEGTASKTSTVALIGYGLMTPLGTFLAVVASAFIESSVALSVQSVLESFAAGSFLFVGMMHLQDKTCSNLGWTLSKALPEVFGAGLMILVSFWI
uniref:Zinc/iron permease n=1 Tax=Spongospora subterranea TaxID=70186 RepID=A0A0H5R4P9_9EUKA|eukprot:CRZ09175.1 hypothetical protein [Spongospora subterranea]